MKKFRCPKCGSDEFITKPNRYNVLRFIGGSFQVDKTEIINDEYRIFCRECSAEVDVDTCAKNGRVVLKDTRASARTSTLD